MTAYQQVVAAWNAQADETNQWDALGEDEKIEWALKCADQFRGATKMMQAPAQTAAVAQEPVALLVRKNSWRDGQWEAAPPNSPHYGLSWADKRMYVYSTPQPTKPAPGEPMQEFEKWLATYSTLSAARDVNGYADLTTEMLWHAWQAAAKTKAP